MTITKKAEYAIITLAAMARGPGDQPGYVSSQLLASQAGVPPNLIAQTVAELRRAGWVEARRGPGGGVRLVQDPRRITLRQVIELVEGPMGLTRCLTGRGLCDNRDSCQLRGIWSEAQARMLEVLDRVTVEDLAKAKRPG